MFKETPEQYKKRKEQEKESAKLKQENYPEWLRQEAKRLGISNDGKINTIKSSVHKKKSRKIIMKG